MDFQTILDERRTVRRFQQKALEEADFRAILEAARRASCAANNQQLRYLVIRSADLVARVFPLTRYGARVKPNRDPVPGATAPVAFIAVTAPGDGKGAHADAGAAIQSMEFAAWERGIGCCWIGAFERKETELLLELPEGRTILYLVALGFRGEEPVLDTIDENGDSAYYLDGSDVLHVPKFSVDALTEWR